MPFTHIFAGISYEIGHGSLVAAQLAAKVAAGMLEGLIGPYLTA